MLKTMAMRTGKGRRKDSGQGMTEYIIIVALIAISAIGVTTIFGGNMRGLMGAAIAALAGDTNATPTTQKASSTQLGHKGTKDFGRNGN